MQGLLRRFRVICIALFCLSLSFQHVARADAVTIPDVGVDPGAQITAASTKLGTYVAIAIGVWFAFRIVRAALSWAGRAVR